MYKIKNLERQAAMDWIFTIMKFASQAKNFLKNAHLLEIFNKIWPLTNLSLSISYLKNKYLPTVLTGATGEKIWI